MKHTSLLLILNLMASFPCLADSSSKPWVVGVMIQDSQTSKSESGSTDGAAPSSQSTNSTLLTGRGALGATTALATRRLAQKKMKAMVLRSDGLRWGDAFENEKYGPLRGKPALAGQSREFLAHMNFDDRSTFIHHVDHLLMNESVVWAKMGHANQPFDQFAPRLYKSSNSFSYVDQESKIIAEEIVHHRTQILARLNHAIRVAPGPAARNELKAAKRRLMGEFEKDLRAHRLFRGVSVASGLATAVYLAQGIYHLQDAPSVADAAKVPARMEKGDKSSAVDPALREEVERSLGTSSAQK